MKEVTLKVIFNSDLNYLSLIRKGLRGICSSIIKNKQIIDDIEISVNEAISNVISHSYLNEPGHEIQLTINIFPKHILLEINDKGLKNENPDFQAHKSYDLECDFSNLDSLSEKGRGLFIISKLMDDVKYTTEHGINKLSLLKYFK